MSRYTRFNSIVIILALGILLLLSFLAEQYMLQLRESNTLTGYTLFIIIVALLSFNLRKRLTMIPFFRAVWWTYFHALFGILSVMLFWLHTRSLWPNGHYEQALTLLFYLVAISGFFGYLIQRWIPLVLTQTEKELIYERIPYELHDIRTQCNGIVLECTHKTQSETIAKHYTETLSHFLLKPKNFLAHLLGNQVGNSWINREFSSIQRYLSENEKTYYHKLRTLFEEKNKIDFHYAHQRLLKLWLFIHVPISFAVLVLAIWHLLIVNIYYL